MTARWLQVLPDADAAARRAAVFIAGRLVSAVSTKGSFRMAVSGGSTPVPMFEALLAEPLPWPQVEIYQVDERVLPNGHPDRHATALQAIFGNTGVTIITMPVDAADVVGAAACYERQLPDAFDLVHLGLGLDGSTASLLPGDPVLDIFDRDVALAHSHLGSAYMTLTYRGLSKATELLWLVTGAHKASPLALLCAEGATIPAARVLSERSRFVTDAAAVRMVAAQPQQGVFLWHRSIWPSSLTSTGH